MTTANDETYRYGIGIAPQTVTCGPGNCVPNNGVTHTITLDAVSLADLAADGKISVTVTSLSGNFFFADSVLTAQNENQCGRDPAARSGSARTVARMITEVVVPVSGTSAVNTPAVAGTAVPLTDAIVASNTLSLTNECTTQTTATRPVLS